MVVCEFERSASNISTGKCCKFQISCTITNLSVIYFYETFFFVIVVVPRVMREFLAYQELMKTSIVG